jgi:hypothetical protein
MAPHCRHRCSGDPNILVTLWSDLLAIVLLSQFAPGDKSGESKTMATTDTAVLAQLGAVCNDATRLPTAELVSPDHAFDANGRAHHHLGHVWG